jgi:aminomethyltransferase
VAEHERTRSDVGLFDTCHMGQVVVAGAEAERDLRALLTTDVASLRVGRCRYGFLLNAGGGVLDDLITYRLAPAKWLLVVNACVRDRDLARIRARVSAGTTVTSRFESHGKLDVQGPRSPEAVAAVLGAGVDDLPYFGFRILERRGVELLVSRTGYTGERGFELYAPADAVPELWRSFTAAGARPAGLGARDTLRLEAGLPLYGHELTERTTPVEAGLARFVCMENPFPGRAVLRRQLDRGAPRRLAGVRLQGRRAARRGDTVAAGGRAAGTVTSGSYCPTLGCAAAMVYIAADSGREGLEVRVRTGRAELAGQVCSLPFYTRSNR